MARIRKLNEARDGDSILSLSADRYYDSGELHVVPGGKKAYLTTHYRGECVAFSGPKALKAIANAILKALKS